MTSGAAPRATYLALCSSGPSLAFTSVTGRARKRRRIACSRCGHWLGPGRHAALVAQHRHVVPHMARHDERERAD